MALWNCRIKKCGRSATARRKGRFKRILTGGVVSVLVEPSRTRYVCRWRVFDNGKGRLKPTFFPTISDSKRVRTCRNRFSGKKTKRAFHPLFAMYIGVF